MNPHDTQAIETETGGDLVVRALKAAGVDTVFGIISIHNMPIYDAIYRQGGIRAVPTRSEPGAVNMADGYARATGKLGVAITSTGTGAGNAAGALVEAQTAGTPLLHLTGNIDSTHLDQAKGFIHEAKDQLGMLQAVSKAAYRARSRQGLAGILQAAIQTARTAPGGLVSLEIPIDLQKAAAAPVEIVYNPPPPLPPAPAQVRAAAEILRKACRPVIWAGSGALAAGAAAEVRELAELLGAGVLTSQAGKGVLPEDHPQCIGFFSLNPALKDYWPSVDALLGVGTRFRGQETNQWKLPLPVNLLQIDADPAAIGRSYPAAAAIVADARLALRALIDELQGRVEPDQAYLQEIARLREAVRAQLLSTLGPYERIAGDLRAATEREAFLVRDITISSSTWGSRLFTIYEPRHSIHAAGGGIGQGLQMALGVKLGQPDRQVVALCGDGGFLVNCGEMATAVQENIPVVVILFNDEGYGVIRNIQRRGYDSRHIAVDLRPPDFQQLGRAFGWACWRVGAAAEFRPALEAALRAGQPALVEIDMAAVGPFAVPFAGPPNV